jgi:hypothetical protein
MWLYVQSTGDLFSGSSYVETGYSGAVPGGKNDPAKECVKNVGPIPRGYYGIGAAISRPTATTLPLTADNPNYCVPARSGFLIHGDNSTGTASQGCIILSRATRDRINASDDKRLRVVANSALARAVKQRLYAESRGL